MKMKRMTKYGIYSSSSANIIVLLIMKYSSIYLSIYIFIYLYLFILIEGQSLNQYSFPSGGYSGDDNNYNIEGTKT